MNAVLGTLPLSDRGLLVTNGTQYRCIDCYPKYMEQQTNTHEIASAKEIFSLVFGDRWRSADVGDTEQKPREHIVPSVTTQTSLRATRSVQTLDRTRHTTEHTSSLLHMVLVCPSSAREGADLIYRGANAPRENKPTSTIQNRFRTKRTLYFSARSHGSSPLQPTNLT